MCSDDKIEITFTINRPDNEIDIADLIAWIEQDLGMSRGYDGELAHKSIDSFYPRDLRISYFNKDGLACGGIVKTPSSVLMDGLQKIKDSLEEQ